MDVGIEHHLIDVAGSQCLLVDDGTDVEALGHRHVVEVLDHCHGLAHAEAFGREAGQDVGLGIAGEGHEGLRVLDAFLVEQTEVASVAVDDHDAAGVDEFVELVAASLIRLEDLHLHVLGHEFRGTHGRGSATHDHDVLHVGIAFLAHDAADVGDVLARGHEVGDVVEHEHVVASRDDGLVAALDGHDVVGRLGLAEVLQRLVQDLAGFAQLDAEHDEGTVVDVPALAHPRHFQSVGNVDGGQVFGIDERGDARIVEERLHLRIQILAVVDLGHGAMGTECLGQHAGIHVQVLVGRDGYEQVGRAHTSLLQRLDARRQGLDGHEVVIAADVGEPLSVGVDEHRVVVVARQQLGQMGSDGVGAYNDDLHFIYGLLIYDFVLPTDYTERATTDVTNGNQHPSTMLRLMLSLSRPTSWRNSLTVPCSTKWSGSPRRVMRGW